MCSRDPIFAVDKVEFFGQPVFAVVAETRDAARRAAHAAKISYRELPHAIDVESALAADYPNVTEPLTLKRGEAADALKKSPHVLRGRMEVGGQDHFYLEGHIAFAIPGEDEDVTVHSSTQHPSEVQHMVAHVLGVASNAVTILARRMGGGFGGCTINLVAKKEAKAFSEVAEKAYKNKFAKDCSVYFIELSQGTHLVE